MDFSLVIPSFIAGLLTFLAPCTLPLVPGYLSFISGVSLNDLQDPEKAAAAKRKILLNGILFTIGFSIIFVLFGTLAGFVGQSLVPYRIWLSRLGGVFVIAFGLFMLHVIKIPFLNKETHFKPPKFFQQNTSLNSLLLGSAFGFGWTPCVGPILGSILLLASTSSTAIQGGFLLAVFSLGLAIPFVLIAAAIGSSSAIIQKLNKFTKSISIIGGIFLVLLGILLLTNNMGYLISYGYKLFGFVNYEALLDYL